VSDTKTIIDETIKSHDVVLYMKGTKSMPQCGFSSRVAGVLNYMEVDYQDINVLADENIRQGIKDYSDWPTIPQLYVKGEFVGGCDIITEMTLSGELDTMFEENSEFLFSEDQARYLLACNFDQAESLFIEAGQHNIPVQTVGSFRGDSIAFGRSSLDLAQLSDVFNDTFENLFQN